MGPVPTKLFLPGIPGSGLVGPDVGEKGLPPPVFLALVTERKDRKPTKKIRVDQSGVRALQATHHLYGGFTHLPSDAAAKFYS